MSQKINKDFLSLLIFLLVIITSFFSPSLAQDEPTLLIEIYDSIDWNESAGTVFFEGRSYDIMVSTENEPVVLNVTISLLGVTYVTNLTEPFITVVAPRFDDKEFFIINATKEGYISAEVEITVMKGRLLISTDRGTIEENKMFQVIVKDQDNTPVEGAYVYITTDATPLITDADGVAYLRAPEVEILTTSTIEVIKSGYLTGSTNIRVENIQSMTFGLTESQFLKILPILIAVLVVLFSIGFVIWRQRNTPSVSYPTLKKQNQDIPLSVNSEKQRQQTNHEPGVPPEKKDILISTPISRVEEIRIPMQKKKKETTILPEETALEPVSKQKKKKQEDWFKGQEYMRYRLDELTGKIDQKTDGKWFEGQHESKSKVDETLRKSYKKKKDDEEIK